MLAGMKQERDETFCRLAHCAAVVAGLDAPDQARKARRSVKLTG